MSPSLMTPLSPSMPQTDRLGSVRRGRGAGSSRRALYDASMPLAPPSVVSMGEMDMFGFMSPAMNKVASRAGNNDPGLTLPEDTFQHYGESPSLFVCSVVVVVVQ